MIARKYAYLVAPVREKHFGRAAAACHVSPSTLSRGGPGNLTTAICRRAIPAGESAGSAVSRARRVAGPTARRPGAGRAFMLRAYLVGMQAVRV